MSNKVLRTVIVSVRLTPQELDALRTAGLAEGRTPSQVIRTRIFGVPLPVIPVMQSSGPIEVR